MSKAIRKPTLRKPSVEIPEVPANFDALLKAASIIDKCGEKLRNHHLPPVSHHRDHPGFSVEFTVVYYEIVYNITDMFITFSLNLYIRPLHNQHKTFLMKFTILDQLNSSRKFCLPTTFKNIVNNLFSENSLSKRTEEVVISLKHCNVPLDKILKEQVRFRLKDFLTVYYCKEYRSIKVDKPKIKEFMLLFANFK